MTDREYLARVESLGDWTEFEGGGVFDSLQGRLTHRRNRGEPFAFAVDAERKAIERSERFEADSKVRAEQEALVSALVAAANEDARLSLGRFSDRDHTFAEDMCSQQIQSMGHVLMTPAQRSYARRLVKNAQDRKKA